MPFLHVPSATPLLTIRKSPLHVLTRAVRGDVLTRETFSPFSSVDTWYATRDYPYLTRYVPITFTGQSVGPDFIGFIGFVATPGLENWDSTGSEFSTSGGALPPGLSLVPGPLDAQVIISGTPTATGSFPFTVLAENGEGYGEREFPFVVLHPIQIVEFEDILDAIDTFTGGTNVGAWDGILIPFGQTNGAPFYVANIAPNVGLSRFTITLGIDNPTPGFSIIFLHDTVTAGGSNIASWAKAGSTVPPSGSYAKTGGGAFWPDPVTIITV